MDIISKMNRVITKQGHYLVEYSITSIVSINESSYLPEVRSTQQAKSF